MNTEIYGVALQVVLTVALSYPLGRYIAKVYKGEKTLFDFMAPVERLVYRFCGIDPSKEMDWKQFLKTLLTVNLCWFLWGMLLLILQGALPLNPDGNPGQSPDLAFNTAVSFLVNCNLQHYSGETGLTYFTQLFVVMLFQFVTAACGMAALAGIFKALAGKTTKTIGNFWVYLVKSVTRILLPLSLAAGILLIAGGVPMTFEGAEKITTLEGAGQTIAQGPAAAVIAIKQLGTNGGGYYGTNSAHPLENPGYFTNTVECCSILLIPAAMVFALGFYLKRKKLAWTIFGAMFVAYMAGVSISVCQETGGSPAIADTGIRQDTGSMEGKEVRIGTAASALWGITTTVTSNGSVNSMHDSQTPLSGMLQMLDMQINCWFGGVGVGLMNYYTFLIIAVFISGLMVGRTPEFLGKKIEGREMKIATIAVLLHPMLILTGTALACGLTAAASSPGWTSNPSFHSLSEMLYEYTSAAANNGSGFEGLRDDAPFWNISTGIVLMFGRYVPIIGQVAIAGLLAGKKHIPQSAGTLRTDTVTFAAMTMAVILIVAALSFFPALTLGPVADYLSF